MSGKPFSDIPMCPGAVGWGGHVQPLRKRRAEFIVNMAKEQQDLVRLRFFKRIVTVANGPNTIYDVLVGKAKHFEKSPVLRMGLYPLAGDGLFTSEGELWKRQRKLMSPLFRFKGLGDYADAMAACAERGTHAWRDGEVLDIARETTRIAMSVAGKTLFDADTFSEADELGEAMTTSLDYVNELTSSAWLILQVQLRTRLMLAADNAPPRLAKQMLKLYDRLHKPILLPNASYRRLRAALDVLEDRVERMIAERLSATTPAPDLLTQLLLARDEDDGATMSHKQVRDEILTLFIAGHETTASGLAWSLYLLARHPEAYAQAQAEVNALTSDHVGFDDVKRLPYCAKVFKEALRMYPPIYIFGRQAMAPVELADYHIPRGTIVLVSPLAMHHRPDFWPQPERFDPERFTPEAEKARPREAYLPFSGGARTCIGNHFALMEGPIVLATLMRRATFSLTSKTPVLPEAGATLRPKDGIPLRVHLRSAQTAQAHA